GEWHHLIGIVDGSTWHIWVDGKLEDTVTTNHSSVDIAIDDLLAIGYFFQGTGEGEHRYFDGTIDNGRIYNRPVNS
ncbi:MAG: LamG-like jellyroll fold domain-containing protein, partial [Tunicatimonas sp.]|uniref:LamG-like jellyroll fold domain-containing protein n=1 Tax=Tunicatimonas sp. TaxID=1940096 RepID=UPI003C765A1E